MPRIVHRRTGESMGGGLFRFVTFCLVSSVPWYGRQMLPNVAQRFDKNAAVWFLRARASLLLVGGILWRFLQPVPYGRPSCQCNATPWWPQIKLATVAQR